MDFKRVLEKSKSARRRKKMKKKIVNVKDIKDMIGEEIDESSRDSKRGDVYQELRQGLCVTYENTGEDSDSIIRPGVYQFKAVGFGSYELKKRDMLLEPNVAALGRIDMTGKIKMFFEKSQFFSDRGLIPKRGILLHGLQGSGKTHQINQCVHDLLGNDSVAIYVAMDEIRISSVVGTLEDMILDPSIKRVFFVIEDLGGSEMTDQAQGYIIPSDSDLLAFLDGNTLPWKKLPTVIMSTTNYAKNFLENILDRPGRFDEIIEFKLPSGEAALAYIESLNVVLSEFDKRSILKGDLSLAHCKEAVVRNAVYGDAIHLTLDAMRKHSEKVSSDLGKKLGF